MGHMRVRDPMGGSNQSGLRDQNARLVLSYIRRHGAMASAEIARRSGLSAQTVSNIVRSLETKGLLRREAAIKGRVGKPSVPMALRSEGTFGLGLSVGRRSLELMLVDFKGQRIDSESTVYPYPSKDLVYEFAQDQLTSLLARHSIEKSYVAGLGIARPNRIWEWGEFVGAPEGAMDDWRATDLEAEIAALTGLSTIVENDATAACVSEHLLGRGHDLADFAYIFLGTFVGGGLVLDGKLISGRNHNAAAFGPLPVPDGKGGTVQLLDVSSLHVLERALEAAGIPFNEERGKSANWQGFEPALSDWIDSTGRHLAIACAAITSVVEVESILVAGAFPDAVRSRITDRIGTEFSRLDITGIEKPTIEDAVIGRQARSIGAALLPIHAKFFVN
ncbi:MAG: ROK family transcriptional regulator [Pseudomonadota bacterium]